MIRWYNILMHGIQENFPKWEEMRNMYNIVYHTVCIKTMKNYFLKKKTHKKLLEMLMHIERFKGH